MKIVRSPEKSAASVRLKAWDSQDNSNVIERLLNGLIYLMQIALILYLCLRLGYLDMIYSFFINTWMSIFSILVECSIYLHICITHTEETFDSIRTARLFPMHVHAEMQGDGRRRMC